MKVRVLKLKINLTYRRDNGSNLGSMEFLKFIEEFEAEYTNSSIADAVQSVYYAAMDSALARGNCSPYQVTDSQLQVLDDTTYTVIT